MALAQMDSETTGTGAGDLALKNWEANRAALAKTQAGLVTRLELPEALEWIYARDGALSARDPSGNWISGCSVPLVAAREMMKEVKLHAPVTCFVAPMHGAQLQVALENMPRGNQGIVAIVKSMDELSVMLCCQDFSEAIAKHRLFFAAGEDWERELATVFEDNGGLPTPSTFVRLITTPQESAERIINKAQKILARVAAARMQEMQRLVRDYVPQVRSRKRVCLVAPSEFRLWDDAGHVLANAAASIDSPVELRRVDPDDPGESSPLAVAKMAAECDLLLTVNLTRADLPQVMAMDVPWISWMTAPKVPAFASAGPKDQLLLADGDWVNLAKANGWPVENVHLARWPGMKHVCASSEGDSIVIAADTLNVPPVTDRFELSSHNLLWELIHRDLTCSPFNLGDLGHYISQRMRRLNIADENLDRSIFINELITPLYQQLIAKTLVGARVPLVIHGQGWQQLPDLAACWGGPVRSRQQFEQILQRSVAVVDVWPVRNPALDAVKRVVRHMGSRESLLAAARECLTDRSSPPADVQNELSGPLIARVMGLES